MPYTVLEGSTFCVCDERGDVDGSPDAAGLFVADTRFLSRSILTLNGARPEPLSQAQPAPHVARFVLRNLPVGGLRPDEVAVERERSVTHGMEERVRIHNLGERRVRCEVALDLGVDFADIFAVKSADPGFGVADESELPRGTRRPAWEDGDSTLQFEDVGYPARTFVHLSLPAEPDDAGVVRYAFELDPGEQWEVEIDVQPLLDGTVPLGHREFAAHLERHRAVADESLAEWRRSAPRLDAPWNDLSRTWERSVADLAALRMVVEGDFGALPAAGAPWFMTVFGRDTLITCLQTLVFGPELAASALRVLAQTQATEDDPERDAEPGKILHEIRRGKAARAWTDRYYGSVDATPLFLVLLSEVWRWGGGDDLVRELEGAARRALSWLDEYGDRDGDGLVEYQRRATTRGIRNQSWKDSDDSMVFRDGRRAETPIAGVEVQGYVYDAKVRAAELARRVWGDDALADRLEADAAALHDRINQTLWVADGEYYALGLDRDKRQIDGVASNMGHLLWSGVVPPERVGAVEAALLGDRLWSGWGVRTLAAGERAYNPLVYHNGTVWPHDNSLVAWGLARAGRPASASRILRALVEAAAQFDYRLPEVFAGFTREPSLPPVVYPTASSPQAWAAATPVILVQVLLGLEPDPDAQTLRSAARDLPGWAEGLVLAGVRAYGRRFTARVEGGAVSIAES